MTQRIGDDIVLTYYDSPFCAGVDTGVAISVIGYRGLFWDGIGCFEVALGEYNAAFVQDDYACDIVYNIEEN
jgi:hypothetical protein